MFYAISSHYALNQTKFLTETEAENLELLLRRRIDQGDERNCLLLLVALHTGARASEVLNAKVSDFYFETGSIFIRGIKNSCDREIPLPDFLVKRLQRYIKRGLPSSSLWGIGYPRLVQIWQDYRPAQKKFHSLRHTCAVRAYKKTRDIRLVQALLGHRSISNTLIYLDYVHKIQDMRRLLL